MRKLMIAAAIVCAAVFANAATVNWSEEGSIRNGIGDNTRVTDVTAYLVQSATGHTASDVVAAWEAQTLTEAMVAAYALDNSTVDTGTVGGGQKISTTALTAGDSEEAFYVIFNGANMFVSDEVAAQYDSTTTDYTFAFDTAATYSKALPITTAYEGAHWYKAETIEPTPEPTSGLLLVLGLAGLALRRRRA